MFSEDLARAILAERARKTTLRVDEAVLTIRPIEIMDVDRLERMTRRLSPRSIYFRFFAPVQRLPWSALLWLANVDHCRRDALVALDGDEIVGVARYDQVGDPGEAESLDAELAVTVEDAWQHRGLGRQLAHRLCILARERGYDAFRVTILPENRAALDLMRKLAPGVPARLTDGTYEARLPLGSMEPIPIPLTTRRRRGTEQARLTRG
jgi:GNAT superfamily N-acetyltransferase